MKDNDLNDFCEKVELLAKSYGIDVYVLGLLAKKDKDTAAGKTWTYINDALPTVAGKGLYLECHARLRARVKEELKDFPGLLEVVEKVADDINNDSSENESVINELTNTTGQVH